MKEIYNILSLNRLWRTRLYEIGIIEKDFCLFFGLSGLLSRSVAIFIDARFIGYEFYGCLDYYVFVSINGDCLDRYPSRFNEMIESCRIIYAILYVVLKSMYNYQCELKNAASVNLGVANWSSSYVFIMEWLISTFLVQLPFILSIINELKLIITWNIWVRDKAELFLYVHC